jgi:hypothetical protein
MTHMIPAMIHSDTKSEAEKKLFTMLRDGLDNTFTVFHSFNLLTRNLQDKFIEGEIDFLIFSPDYGLLVIEAKSGTIRYDGETGTWFQNAIQLSKSPFAQAQATKYQLLEYLTKKLGYSPAISFAHAVCFPDIRSEMKNLPAGAEPDICINGEQLTDISNNIIRIMQSYQKGNRQPLDKKHADRIRQILMPHFEYGTTMVDRIKQDEAKLLALTEDQCRMLDFIHNRKQALIKGCAGSGKTIMAIKKAIELADEGNRVLLLAYNLLLGERLADSVKNMPNITASTYHEFCLNQLKVAGCLPPQRNDQQYWEKDIPEAFDKYIQTNPLKYDAVIVDEGQDFRVEYWVTIEELRKPDSYFYIFYDPDQNLYKTEMEFPIKETPFELSDNCRNTRNILNILKHYTKAKMNPMHETPEGEQVHQFHGETERARRRHLRDIVVELTEEQKLKPGDIAILGGHSLDKTFLTKDPHVGNYIVKEGSEEGPNIIHYYTYMKFKGCEADAVILLDVDEKDERWSDNALYTAISRAKHLLYIIWKE